MAELGPFQLLDGGKERVEIEMRDDHDASIELTFGAPGSRNSPSRAEAHGALAWGFDRLAPGMRRLFLLLALALAVGVGLAACGDKGTVGPFPETIEGDLEAPEIAIGDAAAGAGAFIEAGCGGCHVLDGVEGAVGEVGPNLSVSLVGKDAAYIQQGIVAPEAVIAEGYTGGVMPGNYGDTLTETQIADLVALMLESSGGS